MQQTTRLPRAAAVLGYGGLVPFIAGAVAVWPPAIDPAMVARVFTAYGAAILAFLGGLQWGIALLVRDERFGERLAVGVLPALVAWVALLLPLPAGPLLLAAAFVALLAWERQRAPTELPSWLGRLRLQLTAVVVACHVIVVIAIA